jgi:gamma-glutamylputrescine oxidase
MASPSPTNVPVWDDRNWDELPALDGEVAADACVIGLGGSGLACVGELLRLGLRVVGVDAGTIGGGAAGRNGGFLLAGTAAFYHDAVAALGRDRARRLYRRTIDEIARMGAETPAAVRLVGSLRIADSPEEQEDCARQLAAMRADDLPAEPYDGPEGQGLLLPTDGAFNPLLRCRTLARRALAAGAQLFERTPAEKIDGTLVTTPRGQVHCRLVIVAVDGKLERVLPELAGRVRTARLQMLATAPAPEVQVPRPTYLRWGYEYYQQLPDGRIALGGFRDAGGEAEWTSDTTPSGTIQAALERFLRERIGAGAPVTHRWAASVAYTASGMPVVAEVRPRVWAVGGYNGTGNVIGAICGRGVARLAATGDRELLAELL